MKRIAFLFTLLSITFNPIFSQKIQEVLVYSPDKITQEFKLETKHLYSYDQIEHDRVEKFVEMILDSATGSWINNKLIVRDLNEYEHMIQYHFAKWSDNNWSYYTKRDYHLEYDEHGEVIYAAMDDYSDTSNKDKKDYKLHTNSNLFRTISPLHIAHAPYLILDQGEQLIFDEAGLLLSGVMEKCRIYEYHYEYHANGLVKNFKKFKQDEYGDWYLIQKGKFIYDEEQESELDPRSIEAQLSVYPNPSRDFIYIVLDQSLAADEKLILSNAFGTVVKEIDFPQGETELQISIADLTAGMYFLNSNEELLSTGVKVIKVD